MNVITGSFRFMNSPIVWDISGFPSKCTIRANEYIESPAFTVGDTPLDKIKWKLLLYPFGNNKAGYVSLFLKSQFCSEIQELEVLFKGYLWNDNEITESSLCKFTTENGVWGYRCFLKRDGDKLKNHLSLSCDSTLSIACSITVNSFDNSSLNLNEDLNENLNKGFDPFFLCGHLSDVIIKIGEKSLNAHKIVLSARSEVFNAMFNHEMQESSENVINITDISYNVMKEVLRFIYCGKVEELDFLNKDLLVTADKYNIPLLKRKCEENLVKNLNVSNACEILNVSHLYQCIKLKEKTILFLIKNVKAIIDTDQFGQINDSNLLTDILRKVVQQLPL